VSKERVDKAWQQRGLKAYSTEAILGTLGHYGIQVSEADYRQLAEKVWPLAIARDWAPQWKGTGQFSRYPFAASEELWRRWMAERMGPFELREALAELMRALSELLQGSQQAAVGPAYAKIRALRERVPKTDKGHAEPAFVDEVMVSMGEAVARVFNGLAEALASEGHVEDAEEFADLEEFLMPVRSGISRSVVRAAKGEREGAYEDLQRLVADTERAPEARLLAVDALLHLKAYAPAVAAAHPALQEAERRQDWHFALDLCTRLEVAYRESGDMASLQQLVVDYQRIAAAHDAAHPDHRRVLSQG
jgi:hypothetical protein